ncbi:UDP-N-acetylmuramyl-tripeptide synthetase [Candidatus Uhrbacteria bacterium]|nr:UDP-N-acetylmuramyl-tripeptide synthetase [Candidatus Uhrbacteria bacterium]
MLKSFLRSLAPEPLIGAYHYVLARFAAFLYRHPSERLIVIGVTGTNGKSTTVQFIGRLLESAGERVGWTTTASFKVADREWVNDQKMTMLGRFQTQKLLREMVNAGCCYAVIETSSQGISQFRHIGINYDVLVFTNLTPEHIEAHGGFENYKAAKGKLFARLSRLPRKRIDGREIEKTMVVNLDDPHAEYFLSFEADRYGGCSWKGAQPELQTRLNTTPVLAAEVAFEGTCTTFSWAGQPVHLKPIGRFYLENTLLAMTALSLLGIDHGTIRRGVEALVPVPGRLEKIDEGQPFTVIVDYAYEPAALAAVYEAIQLMRNSRAATPPSPPLGRGGIEGGRLIHILGSAGGGRDVARRKTLGEMAAVHDDMVIVTNEDPYDEDPMQIINDVADAAGRAGKMDGVNLYRILERQEAIDFAIKIAQPDDLVLITGKGSEPVMAVAHGKKVAWDDRDAVRRALKGLFPNEMRLP